ncbi:uncharacterized protein UTRI_04654 [Ustilago trichophora]|uniref:Uncharacterized protein n=1 Tax=Ustilago trichophora TaxID=86804 RepID=A0A5C3EGN9_9BASI|nr:uncharacterized protein UTRI_04654 [Ustilago trichophora]
MRIPLIQSLVLFCSLAFLSLVSFIDSVDAYEDPAEIVERHKGDLHWLRNHYLDSYFEGREITQAAGFEYLKHYPSSITDNLNKLHRFGTPRWNSDDNLIVTLDDLNREATGLLEAPFHPNFAEYQLMNIRNRHYETFKGVVDWINKHFEAVKSLEGIERANVLRERFTKIRDLALISTYLRL